MQGKPLVNESAYRVTSTLGNAINTILENEGMNKSSLALVTDIDEPVIPFTLIPQYFYGGDMQIGYSMPPSYILTRIKGYSVDKYLERKHVVNTLLSTCDALPSELSGELNGRNLIFLLKQKNFCLTDGVLGDGYKEHRLSDKAFLYTLLSKP